MCIYTYGNSLVLEQNIQGTAENAKSRRNAKSTHDCDRRWKAASIWEDVLFIVNIDRKGEAVICCWVSGTFLKEALCEMGLKEASGYMYRSILRRCSSIVKAWRQGSS